MHPPQWPQATWPFQNNPVLEARVQALLKKMSVQDKVGQIIQADIGSVTPEDVRTYRLGSVLAGGNSKPNGQRTTTAAQWQVEADAYYHASMDTQRGHLAIPVLFGIDAVHGNNGAAGATLFPHNSALGSAHDPELLSEIGAATAEEVRASGLNWAFAPTLAVPQDLRWGRSYEGYSENPQVVASYAGAMVAGLQGKAGTAAFLDTSHVIASAKHFLGDGGTKDGKDQGDNPADEQTLYRVHAAGYPPAIDAGVQTVMSSFSSWQGVKMSGNRALLTDVLKKRMDFGGFVVGDWNSHGQVSGCSNDDCPQAINAGLDMFMAPDSWRGLYAHTLAEVRSGVIPMARLDDAVARILRVKMRLGLFGQAAPSRLPLALHAADVMGSAAHRSVARRAVRESLVLLKNNGHVLPIDPHASVLVAGDGADNISKQSGGWTLNWQGTGFTNADFPGATSIWSGIRQQVQAAGGHAELAPEGTYERKPDVAIVVFGEDPYAEFQGDISNLAYRSDDTYDLDLLKRLRAEGIPVVAVFLTGRPLWVNPAINAADAFVVGWLPGSEGEGIADVLLRKTPAVADSDFRGRLAYRWPSSASPASSGKPAQFAYGYGLTYADHGDLARLSEDSGVPADAPKPNVYFARGKAVRGFTLKLTGADGQSVASGITPLSTRDGSLRMTSLDHKAQEDARSFVWSSGKTADVELVADRPLDVSREANGDVMLVATLRIDGLGAGSAAIGMRCGVDCGVWVPLNDALMAFPKGQWLRIGIPLKCFASAGAQMEKVSAPFEWRGGQGDSIAIADVALGTVVDKSVSCPEANQIRR